MAIETTPHSWPATEPELFPANESDLPIGPTSEQDVAAPSEQQEKDTFYKVITTALNFVAFLLSLVVVEIRYSIRRTRMHAAQRGLWIPWLVPYQSSRRRDSQWHYQRVQSDLLKMETADAFDMRGVMAGVIVVVLVGALAASLFGARIALFWWYS